MNSNEKRKYEILIGVILFVGYFSLLLFTLDDYGFNWDSPYEILSGVTVYNYYKDNTLSESVITSVRNLNYVPINYVPILSIFSNEFFFNKLHILSEDSSFNFVIILVSSISFLLIYFFVLDSLGFYPAIFSSLFFALNPRLFSHFHNNMKDPSSMFASFLFFTMFYLYLKKEKSIFLFASSIALALVFNSKIYNFFVPITFLFWFLINQKIIIKKISKNTTNLVLSFFLFFSVLIFINPVYWSNLMFLNLFNKNIFGILPNITPYFGAIYYSNSLPFHYPFVMIGITTPIIILISFLLGLYTIFKKLFEQENVLIYSLIIIGFFFPIIKYSLFSISIYDGIRQIMDAFPFFFIIAGVGASIVFLKIKNILSKYIKKKLITNILLFLIIFTLGGVLVFILFSYYPYQIAYYNSLIGGVSGAEDKFELDYWGYSFKEMSEWIHSNVEPGSTIIPTKIFNLAQHYLSDGYTIISVDEDLLEVLSKQEIYILDIRRIGLKWHDINLPEDFREPIHSIKIKDVSLLNLYKINGSKEKIEEALLTANYITYEEI